MVLDAPREYINLHVRGGYILPTQTPKGALNTKERYFLFYSDVIDSLN